MAAAETPRRAPQEIRRLYGNNPRTFVVAARAEREAKRAAKDALAVLDPAI